ncbi:T9SS type A sorting domain-containing protein [bacterium]|nr:T9SS type A sorting domain-containing protein [bacterium]
MTRSFRAVFFLALSVLLLSSAGQQARAQLAIKEGIPVDSLVRTYFIGGGAQVDNITYKGFARGIGYFDGSKSNIGINEGVLMTTGWIGYAVGPNNYDDISYPALRAGDPDLSQLVGYFTFDASVLEFDFIPYQDTVSFDYVFASEEYPEYVGSVYNDVFAFYISGPGFPVKKNIALIPGTSIPVAINTVNHIDSTRYYVNNAIGQSVEYDGFTTVLRASAVVTPCETYHLKLAIADVSDNLYDSGVFLRSGSFDAGNQLSVVGLKDAAEGGCDPGVIEIQRMGNLEDTMTVSFQLRGEAINDSDYAHVVNTFTFARGQASYRIPISAFKDAVSDDGEWVTVYIPDICNTGLVRDSIRIVEVPDMQAVAHADTILCAGASLRFEARIIGGSGYFGYEWSGGMGTDRVLSMDPAVSGTYVFTVYDSITGCSSMDTLHVTVEDYPVIDAGPDRNICPGSITVLEGSVVGDNPPYSVVWSPMTGLSNPNVVTPEASPPVTTTYVMTVTSPSGCVSTDTVVVRVSDVIVQASKDTTICRKQVVALEAAAAGAVPPYTYSWNSASSLSDPSSPTPLAFPEVSTTYIVTVRSSNGCQTTDSVRVTVADIALNAGNDVRICEGKEHMIGDTAWTTHAPVLYSWEPVEGLDNPNSPTPIARPDVTTSYVVTATNAFGCSVKDTVQVIVNQLRIDAGTSTAICPGDSVQLTGQVFVGTPAYNYYWSPAEGLSATDIPNPMASPAKSQWYVLTVVDRESCLQRDSVLISVWPEVEPRIDVLGSPVFCIGDSVTLDAGAGYLSYNWSTGASSRTITVGDAGNYWVDVISVDGCPGSSDTIEVIVSDKPAPRISGDTLLCAGAETDYVVPHVSGSIYTWGITGGRVVGADDSARIHVVWETPGVFTVRIDQVFGSASCQGDTTITVTVLPNPSPEISADEPLEFCEGGEVTLRAPPGFASYQWSNGASGSAVTVDSAGRYSVTVTTMAGCSGTSPEVEVRVYPLPEPEIIALTEMPVCEGGTVTLGLTGTYASYLWSDGSNLSTMTVDAAGSWTVRVTTIEGCTAESAPFSVSFNPLPEPDIVAEGPLEFCEGDSVRLRAVGSFARYLWSTGEETSSIVVRAGGSYALQVWTEYGCEGSTRALDVTVHPWPDKPVISRRGDTLYSTTADVYAWYEEIDGEQVPVLPGDAASIISVPDRRYWVVVSSNFGCSRISDPYEWTQGYQARSTVSLPKVEANPGEKVAVDFSLEEQEYLEEVLASRYTAELRYNASLLLPTGSTPMGRIEGNERVIDLTGTFGGSTGVLRHLEFIATLGNAESTPLTISTFTWDQPDVEVTRIHGEFLLGICREGGARLFDATGQLALEPNHPNPFNNMTVITYELIEEGPTHLYVLDMLGRRVATLLDGYAEKGRYQVAFEAGELPSGMYITVLRTPSQLRMRSMKLLK